MNNQLELNETLNVLARLVEPAQPPDLLRFTAQLELVCPTKWCVCVCDVLFFENN